MGGNLDEKNCPMCKIQDSKPTSDIGKYFFILFIKMFDISFRLLLKYLKTEKSLELK